MQSQLVPIEENLVDVVWGAERPARPTHPAFALDIKYAGELKSYPVSLYTSPPPKYGRV
jgi:Xaa-Pro aminopeptidase